MEDLILHGFLYLMCKINLLLQDVAYKPQEFYVQTRKCEPEAGADIVKICERQVYQYGSNYGWIP